MCRLLLTAAFVFAVASTAHAAPSRADAASHDPIGETRAQVLSFFGREGAQTERPSVANARVCAWRCDEVLVWNAETWRARVALSGGVAIAAQYELGGGSPRIEELEKLGAVAEWAMTGVPRSLSGWVSGSDGSSAWEDYSRREIAWRHSGHFFVADVLCLPVLNLPQQTQTPAEFWGYRVLELRIGPAVATETLALPRIVGKSLADAKGLLAKRRGLTGEDPFPLGPTALVGSDYTEETVSVQERNGIVAQASFEWSGDRSSLMAFASPLVLGSGGLPAAAAVTSTSNLPSATGELPARVRVFEWRAEGFRWKARVFCPVVRAWSPSESREVLRPAHRREYRVMSLEQSIDPEPRAIPAASEPPDLPEAISFPDFPVATQQPQPPYPKAARRRGQRGRVVLSIEVDESGHVVDVVVLQHDPLFEVAAMQTVGHWTYKPVLVNGAPTRWQSRVNLNFSLR